MQVQSDNKPYDSMNITPMLDLVYVLLVVFILMTTATVQGLTMTQITSTGAVLLNGIGVTMDELKAQLAAAKARDAKMSVMIKGDPLAQYARVIAVVDMANVLAIEGVGLVTARIGS